MTDRCTSSVKPKAKGKRVGCGGGGEWCKKNHRIHVRATNGEVTLVRGGNLAYLVAHAGHDGIAVVEGTVALRELADAIYEEVGRG